MNPPPEEVERGRPRTKFGKLKDSLKNTKVVRLLRKSPAGKRTSMRVEHVVSTPLILPYPHAHQDKINAKTNPALYLAIKTDESNKVMKKEKKRTAREEIKWAESSAPTQTASPTK